MGDAKYTSIYYEHCEVSKETLHNLWKDQHRRTIAEPRFCKDEYLGWNNKNNKNDKTSHKKHREGPHDDHASNPPLMFLSTKLPLIPDPALHPHSESWSQSHWHQKWMRADPVSPVHLISSCKLIRG
jgi:hypothetical protein